MQNSAAQVCVDSGCFSTIPEEQSPRRESMLLRLASDLAPFLRGFAPHHEASQGLFVFPSRDLGPLTQTQIDMLHCDTNPDRHPTPRHCAVLLHGDALSRSPTNFMSAKKSDYLQFLCVFSWSSWKSLQKTVCRLAIQLRALYPTPEDTHLLILQQLLAFVVWPSSRLAHRAGSCAAVMPRPLVLYLHTDNETQHDLLCLQSNDCGRSCKQKREVHSRWFC